MNNSYFSKYWADIHQLCASLDENILIDLSSALINCHQRGGKIITVGNGGSAAIASHVSVDLTKAAGIRATCFNESSLVTCFANDFGYEKWVVKALTSYADDNDVVILVSSSGQSANMINAAKYCTDRGLYLVTFSGFNKGNIMRSYGQISLWTDSHNYNYVETVHQTWLLAAIDYTISQMSAT